MRELVDIEAELMQAAESIVDAAAWCRVIKLGESLPTATRKVLVRAVMNDPSLTRMLFDHDAFDIH